APLVPFARYLKVNYQPALMVDLRRDLATIPLSNRAELIAKRIERPEEFDAGSRDGFRYFQGFFLGHPVVTPGRTVAGAEIGRLRLIEALRDPLLSLERVEALVRPDAALCYQLLQAVNSAAMAQRQPITSIRQALLLLGRDAVRRWACLWTLA